MIESMTLRRAALIVFLLTAFFLSLALPCFLPGDVGAVDFRPYWSSTALLARGQDFGDPALVDRFERDQTGWQNPYTMLAWFAPTGNVVLLPFTLLPFERAVMGWLAVNISVFFISALWMGGLSGLPAGLALAAVFGFSMTLLSLAVGQVNALVLLGVVGYLWGMQSRREWAAGAALALTTIKPHLVILTLPLILLDTLRGRRWRVLGGLGAVLLACVLLLWALNPTWLADFWRLVNLGMATNRLTPTLSGLLVAAGLPEWGKWLFVPFGLAAGVCWWARGRRWQAREMIDLSLMVGLVVSPVGWSYDQIMLLLPLLRVLGWAVDGLLAPTHSRRVLVLLGLANLAAYLQRIFLPQDVGFFWLPLFSLALYLYVYGLRRREGPPKPA